jgi:aldehyde dehydrogenase (NAD+)
LNRATRKVAPALAAGCAIVFKAAENTPLSVLRFTEILATVGFPDGAFNLVTGIGSITGQLMAEHMDIDKVVTRPTAMPFQLNMSRLRSPARLWSDARLQ